MVLVLPHHSPRNSLPSIFIVTGIWRTFNGVYSFEIRRNLLMSNNYAEERATPKMPACSRSRIALSFDGSNLRATGSKSSTMFPAVSGKSNEKGQFEYSEERQKVPNKGPIPEGEYWVQPSQMWENNWLKSMINSPRSAWGNFRLTIHPYPMTKTHGRGGFFLHGGTVPGSAGCIDLTMHIDKFVEYLTKELKGLPECYIPLTVRYPKK